MRRLVIVGLTAAALSAGSLPLAAAFGDGFPAPVPATAEEHPGMTMDGGAMTMPANGAGEGPGWTVIWGASTR